MLKRTGVVGGTPKNAPTKFDIRRSIIRENETAAALAAAGYNLVQHPVLTSQDIAAGINRNARPDYRIEGILFDCYSPEPPLVQLEQSRLDVFHTEYTPVSETDYDSGWEELPVNPAKSPSHKWQNVIDEMAGSRVLDRIRAEMSRKVSDRQAFGIVVNLTDVIDHVSVDALRRMIESRGVRNLQYAVAIAPCGPPTRTDSHEDAIGSTENLNIGGGIKLDYRPRYSYSEYGPGVLSVTWVFPSAATTAGGA